MKPLPKELFNPLYNIERLWLRRLAIVLVTPWILMVILIIGTVLGIIEMAFSGSVIYRYWDKDVILGERNFKIELKNAAL